MRATASTTSAPSSVSGVTATASTLLARTGVASVFGVIIAVSGGTIGISGVTTTPGVFVLSAIIKYIIFLD
jgi:hypothetical protein